MKKILLDTNAYVRFLLGDKAVLEVLSRAEIVYMSVIVMGELYAGFKGGRKEGENKTILDTFLQKAAVTVLDVGRETSEVFGGIKDSLRKAGTPIPINDVWIAAQSFESGSVLISYDDHFLKIPGLRLCTPTPS